jgi:nucleotide-binding universal stress UspA family protein
MSSLALGRILAATDFSDVSASAVRRALEWASRFNASLFVLSAGEYDLSPRYFTADQIAGLMRQAREKEAQVRHDLKEWVRSLGGPEVPFEAVTGPGPADRAILRGVEVIRPDLLVMGTHGRRGYNRFLMGSTTEKVVRQTPIPVLVARDGSAAPQDLAHRHGTEIRRILCAADRPLFPGAALPSVAELARTLGADLVALHSLEVPGWLGEAPVTTRQEAKEELRELVARHALDLRTKIIVTEGPAYQRILEAAATEQADLIVVGGRQPKSEAPVFGSTAIRVMRHARCPVLAIPAPADGAV